jgi:1-deoxy-D-xylulose-5-phosphate synthase
MTILDSIRGPSDLRDLPVEKLPQLASEIRRAICDEVMQSGGHLAPNLGVVELTIALHYVFDFAWDRLLFDVGHQCYPHKLLTGRQGLFKKLRTREGMAGFPEISESPYDLFRVGHAGTAISTAVGMARGDVLSGEAFNPADRPDGRRVVSLIGDASIVNGVAMEGLNGAGTLKRQFLVILNDNGMSISKPQGALAAHFDKLRLSQTYGELKKDAREKLKAMPGGDLVAKAYHRAGDAAKAMISDETGTGWFEHFGLKAVGPIDGHDLPALIEMLREVKHLDRPIVLHVKTIKGKGYQFAEQDSSKFHSPPAFKVDADVESEGCRVELKSDGRSFTAAVGDAMLELMERDSKVVTCTAAMPDGTGISKPLAKFPDRSWDVGICESHALDMMAGLAKTGYKPFLAVYCTFLQRAFDQAFQESSLQGLPVRLLLDRAGLVGGDGAVHHGFCDVSLLRTLPGAAIMAAIDEPSLKAAMEFMRTFDTGLSSVRYPRDVVSSRFASSPCPPFVLGKARCLTPDQDVLTGHHIDAAILAFGTPVLDAMAAVELTGSRNVAVYDARFAKPVDADLIRALCESATPIITIEDHSIIGGFGAAVMESAHAIAAAHGLGVPHITTLGLPDRWILQDSRSKQLAEVGIDAAGIAATLREVLSRAAVPSEPAVSVTARPRQMH